MPEPAPAPAPEAVPPAGDVGGGLVPAPGESVVEDQLEAQGDDAEANRIRDLREQLFEQLQGAGVSPGGGTGDPAAGASPEQPQTGEAPATQQDGGFTNWVPTDRGEVVEREGNRIIIDLGGGNIYVQPLVPDEGERFLYGAEDVEVQELRGGRTRTIVYRDNGVQIVTIRDRRGNIIQRFKRFPDGREIVLIDNRFPEDYIDEPPILYDLPPLVIGIPEDEYIVDLGEADYDDIRQVLLAPPVQELERPYTLDEVLRNQEVRAYVPRIDLDTITFETGSATIGTDQMPALFELGQVLEEVIEENPSEVYLIEGHTDAVGSDYSNLLLSDRRAEAVAVALSQNFEIPPENLVTEGYGEQFLKVPTDGPERRNRRAAVVRLTDILQAQNQ
jgi:outer membrane protein OmpA-like peptidoglycan-associated protein